MTWICGTDQIKSNQITLQSESNLCFHICVKFGFVVAGAGLMVAIKKNWHALLISRGTYHLQQFQAPMKTDVTLYF